MKSSQLFIGITALALTLCAIRYPAAADQPKIVAAMQHPDKVPSGTYQPFNVMEKIRFGATTLVNPKGDIVLSVPTC